MRYYLLVILISVFAFSPSCSKSKTSDCDGAIPDCTKILCIAHWDYFSFKLVDNTTGEDLLFGTNPRYAPAEVKLFSDAARTVPINIMADNVNKKLQSLNGRSEMYLEIKGTAVYKITAAFKVWDCCSNTVKSLEINNNLVCTCCPDVIAVPVN